MFVGDIELANPVMPASGTVGYGTEFSSFVNLSELGAFVTKSLAAFAWAGNPAPRVAPTTAGMLNAVGLQGPGVESWLEHQMPKLVKAGARIVCSIWGRSVDEYAAAARLLADAPEEVIAVEVNLSCPNLDGHGIFAHDPGLSAAVVDATAVSNRPRWAKLSANTDRVVEVAQAVVGAGAASLTLINTLQGLALDPDDLQPVLGKGSGGLSGRAIHPVAVRTVQAVRQVMNDTPIVGVGGIASGWDAIEMMIAGANAIQVGTANFADPRATIKVRDEMVSWAMARDLVRFDDLPRLV